MITATQGHPAARLRPFTLGTAEVIEASAKACDDSAEPLTEPDVLEQAGEGGNPGLLWPGEPDRPAGEGHPEQPIAPRLRLVYLIVARPR